MAPTPFLLLIIAMPDPCNSPDALSGLSQLTSNQSVQNSNRQLRWSNITIPRQDLLNMGSKESVSDMIKSLKNDYGIEVIVASGKENLKASSRSIISPVTPKILSENGDFLSSIRRNMNVAKDLSSLISSEDAQIPYRRLFEHEDFNSYAGFFLAPGRDAPSTENTKALIDKRSTHRPLKDRPIIVIKDFADRETVLHEFTHFLIWRERQKRGSPDPWATPSAMISATDQSLRDLEQMAEEIDVHETLLHEASHLNLTTEQNDSIKTAIKEQLNGASYTPGLKETLKKAELHLKNDPSHSDLAKTLDRLNSFTQ